MNDTTATLLDEAALFANGPEHDADGVITDEAEAAFTAAVEDWLERAGDKLAALEAVALRADSEERLNRERSALYQARAQRNAATARRVKALALLLVEAQGGKAQMDDGRKVWTSTSAPTVALVAPDQIPGSFKTLKPATWAINKSAIKDALKAGEAVPGAKLTQTRYVRFGK